ncbi:hypothetical protein FBUS_10990 [Fasciolopsis buskii]|uniref:dolichyl-P-Man:Man5GlcNAc2-PP-dolichol alpha-1,3-mannosyltransferase n=1 Tax=Fasciolopsis buskii TaxID=27845 RepID=A0A8E0RYD4_9TREM|nr:hypothetical protein FBUS_10990 [Fasciolopsis buski]
MYKWTVNWRLIPEDMFLDRRFHIMLLVLHLFFMSLLLLRFIRSRGGLTRFLSLHKPQTTVRPDSSAVLYPLFVCNFVGVAFSRSLHYQFYVWYFHTLLYLLWSSNQLSSPVRLLLLGLIELCWNTYPSTVYTSGLLHVCHFVLLICLLLSTPDGCQKVPTPMAQPPKVSKKSLPSKSSQKRNKQKQA